MGGDEQVMRREGSGISGEPGGVRAAVTGASSGLGLAMARALADADVALLVRPGPRLAAAAEDVARRAQVAGGVVRAVPVEVRDPESVAGAVGVLRRLYGSITV